jgi:hypothetical protein
MLSKSESESGSTKFSKGSNRWMNKLSNSLQPTRYHYHLTQVSSCVKTLGIFLESALPKFHSLRAVFAHEEFHDERPHGPDADHDLGQVCWPLRHSIEKPNLAIWADRDSLRMFRNLQDFEGQVYTGQYIDFYFDRFLGMWERCLEVAKDQYKWERSRTMRQKFRNLWSRCVSPFGDQEITELLKTELCGLRSPKC